MSIFNRSTYHRMIVAIIWIGIFLLLSLGPMSTTTAQTDPSFLSAAGLQGESSSNPTSLQFGPDGRLYVAQQDGTIYAYTIERDGPGDYEVTDTELINIIKAIPNYNDDGTPASTSNRQITGIYVTGSVDTPVVYVTSSDPRIGAGGSGADVGLDTNSGILSRLTKTSTGWDKMDLVRGLPRSEENHSPNGMQLDETNNMMYIALGGFTNAGAPSNNFAFITEYALAGAILSVDLDAIDSMSTKGSAPNEYKYDLPTLDDPTRENVNDVYDPSDPSYVGDVGDPFGGNDGLNQTKWLPGEPVQVYSSGYRNSYDLLIAESGIMYTVDNGPNGGWGGYPDGNGTLNCTNDYVDGEPGSVTDPNGNLVVNNDDNLHVVEPGFYAGHAAPIRGNTDAGLYTYNDNLSANDLGDLDDYDPDTYDINTDDLDAEGVGTFRDTPFTSADVPTPPLPTYEDMFTDETLGNKLPIDWPPVDPSLIDSDNCEFINPGEGDGALFTWDFSTNGLVEYTATNFGGAMQGNLLTASFDGTIYEIELAPSGMSVSNVTAFASGFGSSPLDVTAQGDDEIFGGTVWAATYGGDSVTVFEPTDYEGNEVVCEGTDDPSLDEDNDGYTNADEIDNFTNPCSGASKPDDFDNDLVSDLNDDDDDNDGLPDTSDPFAIDTTNGMNNTLPINYPMLNGTPGIGYAGLGFTGWMTDGATDYADRFDPGALIAGGASGLFTVEAVTDGDATSNTQDNGFQFGVNTGTQTEPFTIIADVNSPFFNNGTHIPGQSQGIYIGTGDQDNYLKLVVDSGISVLREEGGTQVYNFSQAIPGSSHLTAPSVQLYLSVDPTTNQVQPAYGINGGPMVDVGGPVTLDGNLLSALQGTYTVGGQPSALAIGTIATTGGASTFRATWDEFIVQEDPSEASGYVTFGPTGGGINASTFTTGSMQIQNTSVGSVQLTDVEIDLSSTLLPDIVFDPDGTAGDTTPKAFTVDSEGGTGQDSFSYLNPHNGLEEDGYDTLQIGFNDFDPGETFTFSIDVDPNSIKGTNAPGPGIESGSVSGLEMTGAEVTMTFSDGTVHTAEIFRTPGSDSDAQNNVNNIAPPAPSIQAVGLASPETTFETNPTIQITGEPNTDYVLLVMEAALFEQPGGGYNVAPYDANSAVNINEYTGSTGAAGIADVSITLTDTVTEGGLNYIAAVLKGSDGTTSNLSNGIILELDPSLEPTDLYRINVGGPGVTTGGQDWIADTFFTSGTTYSESGLEIANTTDDVLYQTERYGDPLQYQIDVVNGVYTVKLHFAEIFHGVSNGSGEGARIFNIDIENGQATTTGYDIIAQAGAPATAIIETYSNINVTDGILNIVVDASVDNAKLSAIEVLAQQGAVQPDELQVSPGNLTFDPTVINTSSDAQTITLEHVGSSEGSPITVSNITFQGADAADFAGDPTSLPAFSPGDTATLDVTFSPTIAGTKTATLVIEHDGENASPIEIGLTGEAVEEANEAPIVTNPGEQTNTEGDTVSLPVEATDPNTEDTLTYSATNLPPALSIVPETGVISGTISSTAALNSPYNVTVTVTDDGVPQESGTAEFQWIVNDDGTGPDCPAIYRINAGGPTITAADTGADWLASGAIATNPDITSSGIGATFSTTDAVTATGNAPAALFQTELYDPVNDASNMSWSFDVSNGDYIVNVYLAEIFLFPADADDREFDISLEGSVPSTMDNINVLSEVAHDVGLVKSATATVSDGGLDIEFIHLGIENPAVKGIEIIPVNCDIGAPVLDPIGNQVVTEDGTVTVDITASDTNPDGTLVFTETGLPDFAFLTDNGNGTASLDITPAAGDAGTYPVTITVTNDSSDLSDSEPFDIEVTTAGAPSALLQVNQGDDDINASSFGTDAFVLSNTSAGAQSITSLSIDLSSVMYPNIVFDPNGEAGDAASKCLEADSGVAETGYITPGDECADPFTVPDGLGGFSTMSMNFTPGEFIAGETFTFSVDIDPNSIQGDPGSGDAGSVSGLEMTGATVTVTFDDGSTFTGELYREPDSDGGSQVVLAGSAPTDTLSLTVDGIASLPASVSDPNQQVTVNGPANAEVSVMVVDSRTMSKEAPVCGLDVSNFESNEALAISEQIVTLDGSGTTTVSITLTQTPGDPPGGLNYIVATVIDTSGSNRANGPVAGPAILAHPDVNQPPLLTDVLDQTLAEGETLNLDVSACDVASEENPALTADPLPDFVNFTDNGDGTASVEIAPTSTDAGTYTITVTATDSGALTDTDDFTITVTEASDPPVANDDTLEIDEDSSVAEDDFNVLTNDTDPNDDDLTAILDTDVTNGTLVLNESGTFTYTPTENFNGTDSFTYFANDGSGDSVEPATVTITINPVNDPPVANDDTVGADNDSVLTVDAPGVLSNDTDPDETDTLEASDADTTSAEGATVTVNPDGSYTYDPGTIFETLADGDTATDTFAYTVSDGDLTDTATVTITVTSANGAPIAVNDTATTDANVPVDIDVTANDTDPDDDDLSVATIDTTGTSGTVTDNGDGTVNYDPAGAFDSLAEGDTSIDQFTYTVQDTFNTESADSATVTVTILGVNDAPQVTDDTATISQDATTGTIDLLANDIDPDTDDAVNFVSIDTTDALGSLTDNGDGTVDYDPNGAFDGLDDGETDTESFTYTVEDNSGLQTTGTLTITIEGINDAPVAEDDSYTFSVAPEVTVDAASGVLANDTDPDDGDTLDARLEQPGSEGGTMTLNEDGSFTYQPPADFLTLGEDETGTETFTYIADDDQVDSNEATITINMDGGNQAPVAEDDTGSTDEDTAISLNVLENDTDADENDTLSVDDVPETSTNGASLTIEEDGTITYDPTGQFDTLDEGETTEDTFPYTVTDGDATDTATVTVEVTGINDAPTAQDDTNSTSNQSVLTVDAPGVLANDTDAEGDAFEVISADDTSAEGASVTVNPDGSYTYDPTESDTLQALEDNAFIDDTFTYTVTGDVTATVTITVRGDSVTAPTVSDDSVNGVAFGAMVSINVLDNDTFQGEAEVTITSGPAEGSAVVEGDNTISFTAPVSGSVDNTTFTYTITDVTGLTSGEATVTVVFTVDEPSFDMVVSPKKQVIPVDLDANFNVELINNGNANLKDITVNFAEHFDECSVDMAAPIALGIGESTTVNCTIIGVTENLLITLIGQATGETPNGEEGLSKPVEARFQMMGLNDAPLPQQVIQVQVEVEVEITENQPPTAADDTANTTSGSAVTIDVLANDNDPEDRIDPNALQITGAPQNGNAAVADGAITYTPDGGYVGDDTLTYEMCDESGNCAEASVSITVDEAGDDNTGEQDASAQAAAQTQGELGLSLFGLQSEAGGNLEWFITVTNEGTTPVQNTVITHSPQNEVDILDAISDAGQVQINGRTVLGTLPSLQPGQSVTLTVTTAVIDGEMGAEACVSADATPQQCTQSLAVTTLPSTGESPWWRSLLPGVGAAGLSLLFLLGLAMHFRRST